MIIFKLIIKISKLSMARDMVPKKNQKNSILLSITGISLKLTMNLVLNILWLKTNIWI